jgi:hypothetical protein
MRPSVCSVAVLTALVVAPPAGAQFAQYTPPGSLSVTPVPTKDALALAMQDAPWTLGTLRIAPWIGLQDLTYYNDVDVSTPGNQSDYSATVGAGLTVFQPFSPRFTLVLQALPQYEWWKNQKARRLWNGRYGLGVFGYFNRLSVEVAGDKVRQQEYVNDEYEVPVNVEGDKARTIVQIDIFRRLAVYGSGEVVHWRYRNQDLPGLGYDLTDLDRNETTTGGGLRYEFREGMAIKVGYQRTRTSFLSPAYDRSNSGGAPTMGLELQGAHLGLNGSAMRYSLDPTAGSQFTRFSGVLGDGRLSWKIREGLTWSLYGGRKLSYGFGSGSTYGLDSRTGLSLQTELGWRGTMLVYVERGRDEFASAESESGTRRDATAYGVTTSFHVGRLGTLSVGFSREEYSGAGVNATYSRVQGGLSFGGGAPALW